MSSSLTEPAQSLAESVAFMSDSLEIELSDGRTISAPLAWYPRLSHASPTQLSNWRLIGNGIGIHWPEIDEDISINDLIKGLPSSESQSSLKHWLEARTFQAEEPPESRDRRSSLTPATDLFERFLSSYAIGDAANPSARFLMLFSRFEYALKKLGYVQQSGERVLIQWRRFAAETHLNLPLDDPLIVRTRPLVSMPPAKQVVRNGQLEWLPEEAPTGEEIDLQWLLDMTYRLRNNLFHGGKWPFDPARDVSLIEAGEAVLAIFTSIRRDLEQAFRQEA